MEKDKKDKNELIVKKASEAIKILDAGDFSFGSGTNTFAFMASAKWCQQDTEAVESLEESVTRCNDGEYVPESLQTYGKKVEITANYEAKLNTTMGSLTASVGGADAIAVESISINTSSGAKATASVKGHSHPDSSHKARIRTITIPAFNGFGASQFGLDTGIDDECITSGSYEVTLDHKDRENNQGNHLTGITHGEKHVVKLEYVSDNLPEDVVGWIKTSSPESPKKTRDDFYTGSVTYEKYVAYVAP